MTDMTPEQAREYHLGRIRAYAIEHGLTADAIVEVFEAGLAAASRLTPGKYWLAEATEIPPPEKEVA